MIGVFDSGLGGLTVVREIIANLPQADITYFGDTARLPYGSKSEEAIIDYAIQDARFLIDQGADIIVIACHTASAIAAEILRQKFPETQIFDVVVPAINQAIAVSRNKKVGLIGTQATVASHAYEKMTTKIDSAIKIYPRACPLFVPLVEEGFGHRPETRRIAKGYLRPFKDYGCDTVILGCTHYPIISDVISAILGPKITLINPGKELAREVASYLGGLVAQEGGDRGSAKINFFVSDFPQQFEAMAGRFLGRKIDNVQKARLSGN